MTPDFERDGFTVIRNAFSLTDLAEFETAILRIASQKLGETAADVYALRRLEQKGVEPFFDLCSHAGGTIAGLRLICSEPVRNAISKVFGWNAESILPQHPFLFWNDVKVKRLAYDWHQECNFYNGIPSAAHLWFPLFNDIGERDGPMLVLPGSHKEKHPYTFEKPKDGVTQLHVDPSIVGRYIPHACTAKRGDAVLFHHNLIHSTGDLFGDRPRMAAVVRLIDVLSSGSFHPIMECTFKGLKIEAIKADAERVIA